MRVCALIVAGLLLAAPVSAKTPRIRVAKAAALAYWGQVPCGGNYTTTVGDLPPAVNAHASYFAFNGTVTQCQIVMARGQFGFGLRADPVFFCAVFTHEVGHLLQVRFHPGYVDPAGVEDPMHSPGPADLMYPFYLGGPQIPPGCQVGGNDRVPGSSWRVPCAPVRPMSAPHRHHRNARRLGFAFWSNTVLAVAWTAMVPVTLLTSLKASIPFLAAISLYALVVGHATGAIASLAGKTSSENAVRLHSPDDQPGP